MSRRMILSALSVSLLVSATALASTGSWQPGFHVTGADGYVTQIVRWQGDVIAGGSFSNIGDVAAHRIARRLDDLTWEQFGQPLPIDNVKDFCEHEGALHVLGDAADGGRVWRLVNDTWEPVGDAVMASALASYAGALHAGPYRRQDGAWVDVLQTNNGVTDLTVHDGLLVAAGLFSTAAGVATGPVAAWDGEQVVAAYPGQTHNVRAVAAFDGQLYVARSGLSGIDDAAVQVWNGGGWSDMWQFGYTSHSRYVTAMTADADRLQVCIHGHAILVKYSPEASVLHWDGQDLTTRYNQQDGHHIYAALDDDDGLLVGGRFTRPGSAPCTNLARWQDDALHPVCTTGRGVSRNGALGEVEVLTSGANGLIVGGGFTALGSDWIRNVAVHDENQWSARDQDYTVVDLTWDDGRLIGMLEDSHVFTYHYGYWQDDHWVLPWLPLETPRSFAIESWNDRVFVGSTGDIREVIDNVLMIPMAGLSGGWCRDLAAIDGMLVAAGDFTEIDGVPARYIAAFDGTSWQPFGEGPPQPVLRLGAWQGRVVAVCVDGDSNTLSLVAAWDGSAWQVLGEMPSGFGYYSLQQYDNRLYVGGPFVEIDGQPVSRLACWTGDAWEAAGEFDHTVRALAVHDGDLWAGGQFSQVDGVPSAGLAVYRIDPTAAPESVPTVATLAIDAAPNPFNPSTSLRFSLHSDASVRLEVYDVAGRRLATILDEPLTAGEHRTTWTGLDDRGRALPSGTYLVRLRAGAEAASARVSLVR